MSDTIAGLLILLGGAFGVIGALGLLRMPDILIRMHASTKIARSPAVSSWPLRRFISGRPAPSCARCSSSCSCCSPPPSPRT